MAFKSAFNPRNFWIFPLIVAFSLACKKNEENTRFQVMTGEALPLDGGGIRMVGSVSYNEGIVDHGFLYAEDSLMYNNPTTVSLGPLSSEHFQLEMHTGFNTARTYFFKAYAKIGNATEYGAVKKFVWQGSRGYQIDSIRPQAAHLGDTLAISGNYFDKERTKITICGTEATIIQISDTLLHCVVPVDIYSPDCGVQFQDIGNGRAMWIPYTLATPVIEAFDGDNTIGDTITIQGQHFDTSVERTKVYFGNFPAQVIHTERTTITAIVPPQVYEAQVTIYVEAQRQKVASEAFFSLPAPEIHDVPSPVRTGSIITIQGRGFHPIGNYDYNQVFFNEVKATLNEASQDHLKVWVPDGPFPQGVAKVSAQVFDASSTYEHTVLIADKWLMVANNLPIAQLGYANSFTLKGKGYVVSTQNDQTNNRYLYQYTPGSNTWEKLPGSLPIANVFGPQVVATQSKGYFYTGGDTDNFYEFDPATNRLTKKASFPGSQRIGATLFSIDEFVYVGIGYHDTQFMDEFYRYDPATDQWQSIERYPGQPFRINATAFVLGGKAYVAAGATNTGQRDVWAYDPGDGHWTRKADVPVGGVVTNAFSFAGKGYLCNTSSRGTLNNECWEYDPVTDRWEEKEQIGNKGRGNTFCFVIGGKIYFGDQAALYVTSSPEYPRIFP